MNPSWWHLTPPKASSIADEIDTIYAALWGMTAFFTLLIAFLILAFMIKYRRSKRSETPSRTLTNIKLEIGWCFIPLFGGLAFFAWGAKAYLDMYSSPPASAYEIYVTGKQWMWKFQHTGGQREINELHIPKDKPVELIMISQDVIHSFYVPAFRMKHDVLPMYYTRIWFQAIEEGQYPLFCSEYCGTLHAGMIGRVVVMNPRDFSDWLTTGAATGSPASDGETLLTDLGCRACHALEESALAPRLEGIFGQSVTLEGGSEVVIDENYLRESILNPAAKVVANYRPVMPPYEGRITEDQLMQIIAYLKSTGAEK